MAKNISKYAWSALTVSLLLGSRTVPFANAEVLETELSAVSVQEVFSGYSEEVRIEQKELYMLGDYSHLKAAGLHRGHNHDAQNLGIVVSPNTQIKIRQANENFNSELYLKFYNDDEKKYLAATIPANGDWVTITSPDIASVPFIKSSVGDNNNKPVIEFEITEGMNELPIFEKGDDEVSFFEEWELSDSPYAVYESSTVTLLVPVKDKNVTLDLNYILEMYDNMVDQYNRFAGLSDDASQPWNQNVQAKYLILANKNGGGAAYYSGDHTGQNGDTLSAYLAPGWLAYHEFAHGYQGGFFSNMTLSEIWNNIYANYFEHNGLYPFGDWLEKEYNSKAFEQMKLEKGYYGAGISVKYQLYFWIHLLDKIGPETTMAYFNQEYRNIVYNNLQVNLPGENLFIKLFSDASGYNVAPYFEAWGLETLPALKETLNNSQYMNIYNLRDLMQTDEQAEALMERYQLESIYSLIETEKLQDSGYYGDMIFDLGQVDDALFDLVEGKDIKIYDGKNLVTSVKIDSKSISLHLPIGLYTVKFPESKGFDAANDGYQYIPVVANETQAVEVNYQKITSSDLASDYKFDFLGLGYSQYGSLKYNLDTKTMNIKTYNVQPHVYFDTPYSSIVVKDTAGNVVYSREHRGDEHLGDENTVIAIEVGYTVEIYHQESHVRLKVYPELVAEEAMPIYDQTVIFEITEFGPKFSQGADLIDTKYDFIQRLEQYTNLLIESNTEDQIFNDDILGYEKRTIKTALNQLTETEVQEYFEKYPLMKELFDPQEEVVEDTYVADKIYLEGDEVIYKGVKYTAKWWVQGEAPDQSQAWERESSTDETGTMIYDSTKAYVAGDEVIYNGVKYTAKWWVQGEAPDQSQAWERESSTDETGTMTYDPTKAYVAGDEVIYNGVKYTAKWWVQGEAPDQSQAWEKAGEAISDETEVISDEIENISNEVVITEME